MLKYDKELYTDNGFYNGDFGDEEIGCYKEKLVKTRKVHECASCGKEIPVGEYAVSESGFMEGMAVSCYTCHECVEEWLEESGQIDMEDEING